MSGEVGPGSYLIFAPSRKDGEEVVERKDGDGGRGENSVVTDTKIMMMMIFIII